MEYVVIGSAGFIGQYLTHSLGAVGIDRRIVDLSSSAAAHDLGELIDGKACVFCACVAPDDQGWSTEKNIKILEPFISVAHRCTHVTYLSSDMVYPYDVNVTEKIPVAPDTIYGKIHVARETALKRVVGDRLMIARLAQVYGPGDTHNAYGPCRMLREALQGGPIVVKGLGEERRDHIRIDDTVSVLNSLISRSWTGVINIATGQSMTFAQVSKRVQDVVPADIQYEPRTVPVKHRDFDITKLRELLPEFQPQDMNLIDMIELDNG